MIKEMLPNVFDMVGSGLLKSTQSGCGEYRHHAAPIFFAALARNEPTFHQSVEPPRETAGRESQSVGEIAHAHRPVIGLGQIDENLVVTQRQTVFGKTRLESSHQVADTLDERAPRDRLGFVEPTWL